MLAYLFCLCLCSCCLSSALHITWNFSSFVPFSNRFNSWGRNRFFSLLYFTAIANCLAFSCGYVFYMLLQFPVIVKTSTQIIAHRLPLIFCLFVRSNVGTHLRLLLVMLLYIGVNLVKVSLHKSIYLLLIETSGIQFLRSALNRHKVESLPLLLSSRLHGDFGRSLRPQLFVSLARIPLCNLRTFSLTLRRRR